MVLIIVEVLVGETGLMVTVLVTTAIAAPEVGETPLTHSV